MRIHPGLARLGLPLFFIWSVAGAHELDLSFNDSAVRVAYANVVRDNLRLEAGWLTDSDEGDVVHGSFLVTGEAAPASQKVTGGIGVRLAALDGEGGDRDGWGLAIGGSLRWVVPRYDRFSVTGEYYWAPEVLSGGDAEKYVDGTIRVNYSITRQADLFVGARYTGAEFDDRPEILFDTGMHAGLNLRF
jgi:hypothetical protein